MGFLAELRRAAGAPIPPSSGARRTINTAYVTSGLLRFSPRGALDAPRNRCLWGVGTHNRALRENRGGNCHHTH
eukprot:10692448-Alexandrium_andersonii.AAC.1